MLTAATPLLGEDAASVSRIAYAGDLVPFLRGHVIAHGGTNAALHSFPSASIKGKWMAQYDSNGVQIFFEGDSFIEVRGLLAQWYGRKPDAGPNGNGRAKARGLSLEGVITYGNKEMGCSAQCSLAGEDYFLREEHSATRKMTQVIITSAPKGTE